MATAPKKAVRIPKKLADVMDTYFQTSQFAQKHFLKFNKENLLNQIQERAARYGYELDIDHATSDKFKGVFKLAHAKRDIRISRSTLPLAEDWSAPKGK